jgi:hypothetical protein
LLTGHPEMACVCDLLHVLKIEKLSILRLHAVEIEVKRSFFLADEVPRRVWRVSLSVAD